MFKKIAGTISAKILNALFGLILVIVNANYLGAEGVGIISLIILGITILLLISEIIGGGALIYLVPRIRAINLILPSYVWAFITACLFYATLHLVPLLPEEYFLDVVILGLLHSISIIHLYLFLGNEKITLYNVISTFQTLTTLIATLLMYFFLEARVEYFVNALYISYSITCFSSIVFSLPLISFSQPNRLVYSVQRILRHGGYNQLGNILQLLNYRLSYYLIESYLGKASLGRFSVGTQLSESVLILTRSISTVQYTHIANSKNRLDSINLTLSLTKITFLLSTLLFSVLVIIPGSFYTVIFGKDFSGLSPVLLSLFAGIIALSITNIIAHYFSGIGKHYLNSIAAGIGFAAIAVFSLVLIPELGLVGAGIATSVSYFLSALFMIIYFIKSEHIKGRQLLITIKDLQLVQNKIAKFLRP